MCSLDSKGARHSVTYPTVAEGTSARARERIKSRAPSLRPTSSRASGQLARRARTIQAAIGLVGDDLRVLRSRAEVTSSSTSLSLSPCLRDRPPLDLASSECRCSVEEGGTDRSRPSSPFPPYALSCSFGRRTSRSLLAESPGLSPSRFHPSQKNLLKQP